MRCAGCGDQMLVEQLRCPECGIERCNPTRQELIECFPWWAAVARTGLGLFALVAIAPLPVVLNEWPAFPSAMGAVLGGAYSRGSHQSVFWAAGYSARFPLRSARSVFCARRRLRACESRDDSRSARRSHSLSVGSLRCMLRGVARLFARGSTGDGSWMAQRRRCADLAARCRAHDADVD